MVTTNGYEKMIKETGEMRNLFVNYDLSEKLKKAGFDYPCFGYYWDKNWEKNTLKRETFHYTVEYGNYNRFPSKVSAPLYDQVINWFREKHDLYLGVDSFTEKHMDGNVKFIYEIRYKGEQYICENADYEKIYDSIGTNDYRDAWNRAFNTALTEGIEEVKKLFKSK